MSTEPGPEKKLRPKYLVSKIISSEGEDIVTGLPAASTNPEDVDSPFVLMPRKDPAAYAAMIAYAQCCEPKLAAEIAVWLNKIAEALPAFGTQGARNYTAKRKEVVGEI